MSWTEDTTWLKMIRAEPKYLSDWSFLQLSTMLGNYKNIKHWRKLKYREIQQHPLHSRLLKASSTRSYRNQQVASHQEQKLSAWPSILSGVLAHSLGNQITKVTAEPEKICGGSTHILAGSNTGKWDLFPLVTTWVLNKCWVTQQNLESLQYIHSNCNPSEKKYMKKKTSE